MRKLYEILLNKYRWFYILGCHAYSITKGDDWIA